MVQSVAFIPAVFFPNTFPEGDPQYQFLDYLFLFEAMYIYLYSYFFT